MKNFSYARAEDQQSALSLLSQNGSSKFLGGGTNLVDLMRENIEQPDALVDITRLPLTGIEELPEGGIRIGALVRNSRLAENQIVRERYPVLSQAILMGASAQLRNMATTGGNLMQRTRCYYFYDTAAHCNKRLPGTGCDAIDGFNRIHAILGTSPECIATHPSDMCVAMAALDAVVQVAGKGGQRSIPLVDFHRLPGDTPNIDTNLQPDELITAVDLPAMPFARKSLYRKVRDRASYAFAIVSVAAALEVENGVVKQVRLALGGVAHKPWRASKAEQHLIGKAINERTLQEAAQLELEPAQPLQHNGFKIDLAKRTIVNVLMELSAKGAI
ncbi:MAG: xanthine dehydrogenase family protein subunit M [Acidobacteriota bacterium]|nr:xanthine dehydrogenase family protein subunit M [Acidobacteriota bacterium]